MGHTELNPTELPCFEEVVANIRTGHPEGLQQLYEVFRILSASLRWQIGYQDFEDRVHDMFIVVAEAIRQGRLRDARALASYIHGVARLSLCTAIGERSRHERLHGSLRHWVAMRQNEPTPEAAFAEREQMELVKKMLARLDARQREILTRFYLRGESKQQICGAMDLTDTQFRLAKSRAKQRLAACHWSA